MTGRASGSVCTARNCGIVTEGQVNACPRCGAGTVNTRRVRILGWVMLYCGFFLVGTMAVVSWFMLPLIMAGGEEVDGSRFTGSPAMGFLVIGIFAAVTAFGIVALYGGAWQVRHGQPYAASRPWVFGGIAIFIGAAELLDAFL